MVPQQVHKEGKITAIHVNHLDQNSKKEKAKANSGSEDMTNAWNVSIGLKYGKEEVQSSKRTNMLIVTRMAKKVVSNQAKGNT